MSLHGRQVAHRQIERADLDLRLAQDLDSSLGDRISDGSGIGIGVFDAELDAAARCGKAGAGSAGSDAGAALDRRGEVTGNRQRAAFDREADVLGVRIADFRSDRGKLTTVGIPGSTELDGPIGTDRARGRTRLSDGERSQHERGREAANARGDACNPALPFHEASASQEPMIRLLPIFLRSSVHAISPV
ncbi:hypothetical protein [Thauera sp. SDU_THAU2]|uniref:hypothetical protein n=1 Tax=Thauera sp. SDU_THAU2 TaxID=3136633 RepID=UPI00311E0FD9